jgi:hypothetical protein
MTLGMSRAIFPKVLWKSSKQVWCELHEEAFTFFGGATHIVRLDNLKEGVRDPDIYDPEINQLYAAVLSHYGSVAVPCRPYAPDLKGKVESSIGYVQSAIKGKRFESIEEHNAHLWRWNERWAFTRIHGTTKRQVRAMFEEERPFLLPLPATRFEYYQIGERTVHFDGSVEVNGAYYHVPPHYIGTRVVVHIGRLWIRIIDPRTQQLIREHVVTAKGNGDSSKPTFPSKRRSRFSLWSSASAISGLPAPFLPERLRTSGAPWRRARSSASSTW